jgi:hypothetical protein
MAVIEIPDEQAAALQARAAAEGLTLAAWLEKLAEESVTGPERAGSQPRSHRHIGEKIRERMKKTPPAIMSAMPNDGASQHDHYLYGVPKREE